MELRRGELWAHGAILPQLAEAQQHLEAGRTGEAQAALAAVMGTAKQAHPQSRDATRRLSAG